MNRNRTLARRSGGVAAQAGNAAAAEATASSTSLLSGEGDAAGDFSRGGVVDVSVPLSGAGKDPAVDEMTDGFRNRDAHCGSSRDGDRQTRSGNIYYIRDQSCFSSFPDFTPGDGGSMNGILDVSAGWIGHGKGSTKENGENRPMETSPG